MSFIHSIKVFIFYGTIIIYGSVGLFFTVVPLVPLMLLNRKLHFRWCSAVMGYFILMLTCFLEDIFKIKIIITGDNLTNDNKGSLMVLNHRTRLDWMYTWMLYSRYRILKQLKIVLKATLKHIPFLGWGIQHVAFLFLERVWTKDQQIMKNVISYYKSCQATVSLLIFPEGTNLTDETKLKSNNYAAKQTTYNRPYDYCLHPRVTGFIYLLKTMRSDGTIHYIDDVTIGYEGDFPVTEFDLVKGILPKIVHFHVQRYHINDLPQDDEQIGEWLLNCWDKKEDRLKEFYAKKQFDLPSKKLNSESIESYVRFQRRVALILWSLFILFWIYCLIAYIKIKIYVLIASLFHIVIEVFADGIIDFVCQLDLNYRQKHLAVKQN